MTVREYIGARYVPIFVGDWDNTESYEPLSIVQHEGDTYTSRQYVPTGIEITNETYWAETGNFNAQVEQYRQEVQTFDGRITNNTNAISTINNIIPTTDFSAINTVKNYIDNGIASNSGISYVGNYGAVEKDDTVNWQSIINQISLVSKTIDFGNGQWYFADELTIPEGIMRVIGNGAVMSVTDTVSTLFTIEGHTWAEERFFRIDGMTFEGNNNCQTFIELGETSTGNCIHVFDCNFADFTGIAIDSSTGLGAVIESCQFINQLTKNVGTALSLSTDNTVHGCKFFNIGTSMIIGGNSQINGNYIFNQEYTDYVRAIVAIDRSPLVITQNRFDCLPIILQNANREVYMCNNEFFWNGKDDTFDQPHYIFYHVENMDMTNIVFSNNSLNMAGDPIIPNVVYSFSPHTRISRQYMSENCVTNLAPDNSDVAPHFAITCGFVPNPAQIIDATSAAKFTRFTPTTRTYDSNVNPSYKIVMEPNTIMYDRFHQTNSLKQIGESRSAQYTSIYWNNAVNPDTFYLTGYPQEVSKVVLGYGAYNMEWLPITTEPSTLTKVTATQL